MNNFIIIGLAGKAQAGKSTSKDILKKLIKDKYPNIKFVHLSFAAKLKEIATDLFGWDGDKEIYHNTVMAPPVMEYAPHYLHEEIVQDKGRQLLINIGMMMRKIRPTVWADYTAKQVIRDIHSGDAHNTIYVVDDVRFVNELNALGRFESRFIKVKIVRKKGQLEINDVSEKDLDNYNDWDLVIYNDGDVLHLEKNLNSILTICDFRLKKNIHSNV